MINSAFAHIYQLSYVLDKFRLNGILAGYGKLQVKSPMGQMINEEPYFHLDVVSDFWVFRYVQFVILKSVWIRGKYVVKRPNLFVDLTVPNFVD